jgi:hypothetical protein
MRYAEDAFGNSAANEANYIAFYAIIARDRRTI